MGNSTVERALFVTGLVTVVVGIILAITGASLFVVRDGELLFILFSLFAFVQAARGTYDFWTEPRQRNELPAVEGVESGILIGEPFDRALERSSEHSQRGARNRQSIRQYLRATAVGTLVAQTGVSRDEARRQIEEGTWTDDARGAALFLTDTRPTWRDRIRAVLGRETAFQRQVRRAISALEEIGDDDG